MVGGIVLGGLGVKRLHDEQRMAGQASKILDRQGELYAGNEADEA